MSQAPTVDTIISRLRPRDVGGIIDQSFRLYRRHFWTFLAIVAAVYVPVQVVLQILSLVLVGSPNRSFSSLRGGFGSSPNSFSSTELSALGVLGTGAGLLTLLLSVLSQYFIEAAVTAAVADSHMDRPLGFRSAYRQAFARAGALLGYMGLQVLMWIGIFLPMVLLVVVLLLSTGSGSSGGAATAAMAALSLAFCLLFPALIFILYVYIRWRVVVPAIVVEGLGPVEGIRRSWRLTLNYWWRTLGLVALLGVISYVISVGPTTVIVFILLYATPTNPVLASALSGAVGTATSLLFLPLELIAITLYYFDLRVRKEGFDLDAAMRQAYQYGQAGYGYGYPQQGYAPQGYGPASGYGAYGQPTQDQYGQYQYPQGQPQPNPAYPPVPGYEQQGQQTPYPSGYPPAQGQQYAPEYPAQYGYGPAATPQPQETVNLGTSIQPPQVAPGPLTPASTPATEDLAQSASDSGDNTPYGNDPLGLYPSEEQAQPAEEPRQSGGEESGTIPEKREPEV